MYQFSSMSYSTKPNIKIQEFSQGLVDILAHDRIRGFYDESLEYGNSTVYLKNGIVVGVTKKVELTRKAR